MLIGYPEAEERRRRLAELKGIEDRAWVGVEGFALVYAIADEDMERENEEKTSAVHFLRFELDRAMTEAVKRGARLAAGVDHPHYHAAIDELPPAVRSSLAGDLHG
jgi:hypothetical protein